MSSNAARGDRRSDVIGLVGVGLLGDALAHRFIEAGFSVLGFDVDPGRRELLRSTGGECAASAVQVVRRCRRIVLCLPRTDVVQAVLREVDGGLEEGQILVDVTTGDPAETIATGDRLAVRGVHYLDATVAGSSAQAREGQVVVMAGGDDEAVAACADLFSSFATRTFHLGPCGSGARMKLVVNLVLGLNRAALAEGLAYAGRCGIDGTAALDVLTSTVAYSRAMDAKGQKMVDGDFAIQARLSQHLKDVRLILETGGRAGARLPLSTLHRDILEELVRQGDGDLDNSAVVKYFRR